MTPDRWAAIERVYQAARDLDGRQRSSFLDHACGGDAALRQEVESLLAYEPAAARFLESSAPEAAPVIVPSSRVRTHPFVWLVWTLAAATIASFLYGAWLLTQPLARPGWGGAPRNGRWYVTGVAPAGPAAGLLRPGDRLVSFDGDPSVGIRGVALHRRRLSAGDEYRVVVEREGVPHSHLLRVGAAPRNLSSDGLNYLLCLVWCAIGLFIGFVRPGHAAARLACLSAVAVGLLFLHVGLGTGLRAWAPLHVVLAYHFFLLFPSGVAPGGAWTLALRVMFGMTAAVLLPVYAAEGLVFLRGPAAGTRLLAAYPWWFDGLARSLTLAAYCAALVAIVAAIPWNYRRLAGEDHRRRLRWVVLGSAVAVAGQLWWAAGLVLRYVGSPVDISAVDLSNATVAIPIAVLYAVVKHQVFDIRVVIRRGLQYLLARRALQALAAIPLIAIGIGAVLHRDRTIADVIGGSTAWLFWLAAAGLGLAFRRPVTRWLDRRFFREEYDREQVLIGLAEDLPRVESSAELASLVSARLEIALHPKALAFWYRDERGLTLDYSSDQVARPLPFPAEGRLLSRLETSPAVVDVSPAVIATLTPPDAAWLADQQAALLVPIIGGHDRLDGLWVLGERKSETPYSPNDRRLLRTIAKQTAVVRENLRLKAQVDEEQRVRIEVLARLDLASFNLLKECPSCGACFDSTADQCDRDQARLTTSLPVERTIAGRYRLDQVIGRGGMGAVYEAWDTTLRREVAMKILMGRAFGRQTALRRFEREARAAASLNHAGIVRIFDFGRLEGEGAYLVMERLRGQTLRDRLVRNGALAPPDAADWFDSLLDGLGAAHAAGIVHRDLKPENIMRCGGTAGPPLVTILDFGLAKGAPAEATGASLTARGFVVGTIGYMSPEHLRGDEVDHRSDIFAVGVMLAEALTGRKPAGAGLFPGIAGDRWELPCSTPEGRVVGGIVTRCLATEPRHRPASAAALRDTLIPALRACPVL